MRKKWKSLARRTVNVSRSPVRTGSFVSQWCWLVVSSTPARVFCSRTFDITRVKRQSLSSQRNAVRSTCKAVCLQLLRASSLLLNLKRRRQNRLFRSFPPRGGRTSFVEAYSSRSCNWMLDYCSISLLFAHRKVAESGEISEFLQSFVCLQCNVGCEL